MSTVRLSVLLSAAISLILTMTATAQPFPNNAFTYQGRLDMGGGPVDGLADFQFRLWDAPVGGIALTAVIDRPAVVVSNGVFSSAISTATTDTWNTDGLVWLEIAVRHPAGSGPYTTLTERQLLTPAPFSLHTRGIDVTETGHVRIGDIDVSDPGSSRVLAIGGNPLQDGFGNEAGSVGIDLFHGVAGHRWSFSGDESGWLRISGGEGVEVRVLRILGGSDIAEPFDVTGEVEVQPGMVMAIDPERAGELRIADSPYDSTVAGVVSGAGGVNTGMTLSQEGTLADGEHLVALTGRVWCWCDADVNGPITAGDMLTTSSTPGHAMPATDRDQAFGAVIGKAMTPLEEGRGLVLVLVNLH